MSVGLEKLKAGSFNSMAQKPGSHPGETMVVLTDRQARGVIYRFQVKDLYGDNEEVLSEEITEV